jgi:hypothetical protein
MTSHKQQTDFERFGELITYLGQLEYNIINSREALNSMEREKHTTLEELRNLETKIGATETEPDTEK